MFQILDAFQKIEPAGTMDTLKPIQLRGAVEVDPHNQDFFKIAIEERERLRRRTDISEGEVKRLRKALKILSNATSYGIYAEMNRLESDEPIDVICHGIDEEPSCPRVAHPDKPGEYCFPPLAALTGAARLMLALLEKSVSDLGGTYAMEDTDSMAVVATENGGIIPCRGGTELTSDGQTGIKALSWKEVAEIARKFEALNPYDRDAVPGSILKLEEDNFVNGDRSSERLRQIYCYAISAKRYALFERDSRGKAVLLRDRVNNREDRWSEHGLGHLLNPTDPDCEDREWIAQIWAEIISKADLGADPALHIGSRPAVGRLAISSPAVIQNLKSLNAGQKYVDQIKPFNFLLTCHVHAMGHPTGVDP